MRCKGLNVEEYRKIQPLLPNNRGERGRNYRSHKEIINGILFRLRTGIPWRDLPEKFGPWSTIYTRYRRWIRTGLWRQIFLRLNEWREAEGVLDWEAHFVDGTSVRAHQKAAGAQFGPTKLGWSRGGFTTKVHVRVDKAGHLMNVEVTEGQHHEVTVFEKLMDSGAVRQARGRPKLRPDAVVGDKGYDASWLRDWAQNRHLRCVVLKRKNKTRKGPFDKDLYRERNLVERRIAHYKEYRSLAFRYEKRADYYEANWEIVAIARGLKRL